MILHGILKLVLDRLCFMNRTTSFQYIKLQTCNLIGEAPILVGLRHQYHFEQYSYNPSIFLCRMLNVNASVNSNENLYKNLLQRPILIRPLLRYSPPRLPPLAERPSTLNLALHQHVTESVAQNITFRFQQPQRFL